MIRQFGRQLGKLCRRVNTSRVSRSLTTRATAGQRQFSVLRKAAPKSSLRFVRKPSLVVGSKRTFASEEKLKKYGQMMWNVVEEEKAHEAVCRDMDNLLTLRLLAPAVHKTLTDQTVTDDAVTKIFLVTKVLAPLRPATHDLTRRLLNTLLEESNLHHYADVAQAYLDLVRGTHVHVDVRSAMELNAQQKTRMENYLRKEFGKSMTYSIKVAPDILGGFVLRTNRSLGDFGLAAQVKKLGDSFASVRVSDVMKWNKDGSVPAQAK